MPSTITPPPSKPKPSLADVRRKNPFSETTRRERRSLLWFSSIGVFIWLTDTLPKGIRAIGIDEIAPSQQLWIAVALVGIIFYLSIGFSLDTWAEYRKWDLELKEAKDDGMRREVLLWKYERSMKELEKKTEELNSSLSNLDDDSNRIRVRKTVDSSVSETMKKQLTRLEREQENTEFRNTLAFQGQKILKSRLQELGERIDDDTSEKRAIQEFKGTRIRYAIRMTRDFLFPITWAGFAILVLLVMALQLWVAEPVITSTTASPFF